MPTPTAIPFAALPPWLDMAGLTVFAISGALAAVRRRLDVIAAAFFALVTATGGGTLRDLLIPAPVFWVADPTPIALCTAVAAAAWLVPLRWWPDRALEWFDAVGLAAYAVYGAAKALHAGVHPISAAGLGVVTACLGGVIRDVIAGVPSVLMRPELYVTAALVAAGVFVALGAADLPAPWPAAMGFTCGFGTRAAAIRWRVILGPHRDSGG